MSLSCKHKQNYRCTFAEISYSRKLTVTASQEAYQIADLHTLNSYAIIQLSRIQLDSLFLLFNPRYNVQRKTPKPKIRIQKLAVLFNPYLHKFNSHQRSWQVDYHKFPLCQPQFASTKQPCRSRTPAHPPAVLMDPVGKFLLL